MKWNNRFIFGLVSIALAAVIAFVALPAIARQTNGKAEIVRVTQPLRRGSVITTQDIELVEVGGYNLPTNIARTKDDVVGRYAVADLAAGDYILSAKVSFTPLSTDIQLDSIPPGRVAISLSVKTLASGLSDKLQTGDVVRIYHYRDYAKDVPELQFVRILTVTDSRGVNVDYSQELQEDEEKRQSATVTVLATPEQAKVITGLENDGICHVALVCRNNESLAGELLTMQDDVLQELYFPVIEEPEPEDGETVDGEGDLEESAETNVDD